MKFDVAQSKILMYRPGATYTPQPKNAPSFFAKIWENLRFSYTKEKGEGGIFRLRSIEREPLGQ